jgi:hypothetical protein
MKTILIIEKDFDTLGHKIPMSSYYNVVDSIDLEDLMKFITSLCTESWVPKCYWNEGIGGHIFVKDGTDRGSLSWAVFSYLITKEIIMIEDKYFITHPNPKRERYVKRTSFDNRHEQSLYIPIVRRLVSEGWLSEYSNMNHHYHLGKLYYRVKSLEKLGI